MGVDRSEHIGFLRQADRLGASVRSVRIYLSELWSTGHFAWGSQSAVGMRCRNSKLGWRPVRSVHSVHHRLTVNVTDRASIL